MSTDSYKPRPEHKFSFGLWTVGNRGRDPFGDAVRPPVKPVDLVHLLGVSTYMTTILYQSMQPMPSAIKLSVISRKHAMVLLS